MQFKRTSHLFTSGFLGGKEGRKEVVVLAQVRITGGAGVDDGDGSDAVPIAVAGIR